MNTKLSQRLGRFSFDRSLLSWLIAIILLFAGWMYLQANPQHNPLAPLDLDDPPGLAMSSKLSSITQNRGACRAALAHSGVNFRRLPATGDGPCALLDRTQLSQSYLAPSASTMTCPVAAGLEIWVRHGLQQAAQQHMGADVATIEHIGTVNCRRMNNRRSGPWSEHATGNAIDIRSFVLSDGRRVNVEGGWDDPETSGFLKAARDAACLSFRTVLSPDYNAAHTDHFHLDQGTRWNIVCR